MAYPVTLNGRTYTLADFEGTNYVEGLPDAFEDFVTHAGDIYNSTSTTSNSIGTGSKTFTVESAKPYQAGTPLRIADAAAPSTNFMDTVVTSYSGTSLVVNSIGYGGSGTKTSWTINIGGAKTIDGTLGVSQGGTGATTAAAARTNLDVYSKSEADGRYINVTGDGMTSNLTFGDNVKATFGASADLEIFHDGAASYIRDAGTGNLRLEGNVVVTDSPDSNDGKITFGDATNAQGVVFYDYSLGDLFIENTWADATADIVLKANSAETMRSNSTGTVFNEGSANMDFRVESNSNANMLFVDAGNNHVNIGIGSDRGGVLNVYGTGTPIAVIESEADGTVLSLRTTDTDANAGPNLELYRNATGAAGDNLGSIIVKGTDASAQDQTYFSIGTQIAAAGNGVEASTVYFQSAVSGTVRERITMGSSALVINQEGLDNDFRVESDNQSHMLFVDASANSIGIRQSSPNSAYVLDVNGATRFDGGSTTFDTDTNANPLIVGRNSATSECLQLGVDDNYVIMDSIQDENFGRFLIRGTQNGGSTRTYLSLEPNDVVVNDGGADHDFRIESDGRSNMFFVDAGNNTVHINGTNSSGGDFNIHRDTASTPVMLALHNDDESASSGAAMAFALTRDGGLIFNNMKIEGFKENDWTGTPSTINGTMKFTVPRQESQIDALRLSSTAAIFNEGSVDRDFRVESDNEANMLVVNAGVDSVVMGGSAPIDTGVNLSVQGSSNSDAAEIKVRTNGKNAIEFRSSSNATVGKITVNASSTTYATTSDYRLKTDIQAVTNATNRLKQLNPVNFEWIAEGTRTDGFLAHEVQMIVPQAVTGTHNETDKNGNPIYQGIDESKLVALLVATIKELEARITALENA